MQMYAQFYDNKKMINTQIFAPAALKNMIKKLRDDPYAPSS